MRHFLVVYDRRRRLVLGPVAEFDDADDALRARWEQDERHGCDPEIEVVILSAVSAEALRTTHGRYFKSVAQLAS